MDYDKISRLMREYHRLLDLEEGDSERGIYLKSELSKVVLDASGFLEKGLLDGILRFLPTHEEVDELDEKIVKLKRELTEYKKMYDKLNGKATRLESKAKRLKKEDGKYAHIIKRIEEIIEGKKGKMIDEIKDALYWSCVNL